MDALEKLAVIFQRFPGIGPRQAGRFVQFLLRSSPSLRRELEGAIRALSSNVAQCPSCKRYFTKDSKRELCDLCANPDRDVSLLAVVAADSDLAALERSGTFRGYYFVLGGTISLASERASSLRDDELLESIPDRVNRGLSEVILALPANPEGDFTASHVRSSLMPLAQVHGFTVTMLGRGLSTGSELEYADKETLRSAIQNRK